MNIRQFTIAILALLSFAGTSFADTSRLTSADGWTKITTLPTNGEMASNYYVIVDNSQDLMLGIGKGVNNDTKWYSLAAFYYTGVNPNTSDILCRTWTFEPISGGIALRNLEYSVSPMQTEWDAAWRYDTNDIYNNVNDWARTYLNYSDGCWTIQNGYYPDSGYLGPWNDGNFSDGAECAANKTGNNVGKFQIYSISRDRFKQNLMDAASSTNPVDVTPWYVTNATFDANNITGWTAEGSGNNFYYDKTGCEIWHRTGFNIHQDVSLPKGKYKVSIQASGSTSGQLYGTSNGVTQTANATVGNQDNFQNSVLKFIEDRNYARITTSEIDVDGTLTIGFRDATTDQWDVFDNFKVYCTGLDPSSYIDALAAAVAAANAFIQSDVVPTAAEEEIAAVVAANNHEYGSVAEYSAAAMAINNAVSKYNNSELKDAYASYKTQKAEFEKLKDTNVYDYSDPGTSASTYTIALNAAYSQVEAATTAAGIATAMESMKAAATTFVKNVTAEDGNPFDLTFLASRDAADWIAVDNDNVAGYVGWALTSNPTPYQFTEAYEEGGNAVGRTGNVLYQQLGDMPAGYYTVALYAAACFTPGRNMTAVGNAGDNNRTFGFANDMKVGLPIFHATTIDAPTPVNVSVHLANDGTLTFGVTKDLAGSNWHVAQIYSITYSKDPDLTTLKQDRDLLVAEAEGVLNGSNSRFLTDSQKTALENAISAANAANTFDALTTVTQTSLPNAIATARQQIAAAKESRVNLIAALERFERDYNLADGTDYSRVTMSAEAWTTLLSKVNDVTEALDDMSLVSEFNTRAQALEDQMDATDGSIKLSKGYLSLLNGVNSYSDATLSQAYSTYKTDTEYTDNDTKVSEAITALDEAFQDYAASQQSNFEAGADHFLGENLDFETDNGDLIDSTWPNVYNQAGWTTLFESDATSNNKQYAFLTRTSDSPREGGSKYIRIRQNWASYNAPHLQILKDVMIPTGKYELKFHIKSENSGANINTDLNFYQLGDAAPVSLKPASDTWTERTYTFEVNAPTPLSLSFGFITASGNSPASVWVDDITLTYLTASEFQLALDDARTVTHAATASAIGEYESYEGHEDQFDSEEARQEAIQVLRNAKAIADNDGDATSLVTNADFTGGTISKPVQGSGGNVSVPSGWDFDYNFDGWNDTNVSDGVFNTWAGTINKAELMQTIQYLPKGIYRLTAQAGTDVTDGSSTVAIYINPNDYSHVGRSQEVITLNDGNNRNFGDYSCAAEVSDASSHQMTLGIYSSRCYYQVKNFTLTYLGTTEDAQVEASSSYLRQDYFWQRNQLEWTATDEKYALADNVVVYPQQKNQLITTSSLDWWADKNNKIVDGVCANLVITDGQGKHSGYAFHASNAFTATNVSHDREFAEGTKLTVCLPYAPTNYNGQFYVLSDATSETLRFESVEAPEAYTPYIFSAGEGGSTLSASNVEIGATPDEMVGSTINGHYMKGVLDNTPVQNIYGFTKTGLLAFAETSSMNPFRAFIQAPAATSSYSKALFANVAPISPNSLLGDVNGDKELSVTDVKMIVDYILDDASGYFIVANADVNKDTNISVSDITSVVNAILKSSSESRIISRPDSNDPQMTDLALPSGTEGAKGKMDANENKILK